jgi:oligopeptide/dipeptide ABC transporter ATP-binding protein
MSYLLRVENLKTHFFTTEGVVRAVDGISFSIKEGQTLCLVGESGSGKSVTAYSILRLIPQPPGRIVAGKIIFRGRNLLELSESEMRKIRGNEISMIFQEPMTSLNPVITVGEQIAEALRLHQQLDNKSAWRKSIELLNSVGIPSPEERASNYPHQLSGGMRQRVMIAMAISCNPSLLIADEPTTALDVTIQAQILDLLRKLQKELNMALILITHDLGIVAEMAHQVAVMYAGQIVESTPVEDLFQRPLHPYTKGLLNSVPTLTSTARRLIAIDGVVPNPADLPKGCRFSPRCPLAIERCHKEEPQLLEVEPQRFTACFEWKKIANSQ